MVGGRVDAGVAGAEPTARQPAVCRHWDTRTVTVAFQFDEAVIVTRRLALPLKAMLPSGISD